MEKKKCQVCGEVANHIKRGFTPSGNQKEKCKNCGKVYTPNPKKNGYIEEEKNQAIKYYYEGNSGRSTGRYFGMSKTNAVRWVKERTERDKDLSETLTESCKVEEMDEMYTHRVEKNETYVITFIERETRQIVGHKVSERKNVETIQEIADTAPKADDYHSNGLFGVKGDAILRKTSSPSRQQENAANIQKL